MVPCMQIIRVRFPENSEKGIIMKEENSLTLRFPVKSFRKIPNPVANSSNSGESIPEMYQLIVDVKELPDNIPMDTNPRKQNLDTKVCKKIKDSLLSPVDRNFYILNRGILLSAASINYDNVNSVVTIEFEDTLVHGNVDGGHTYKVILENRDQLELNRQFVKVEVLTGIENMFESVAASRNTSFQVKEKSIANLRDMFDLIKTSIKNEPYHNDVSYKENDDQYFGAHIGVGREIALKNGDAVDVYGRYFYNRWNSTSFNAGGQFDLDAVTSQVLSVGARYTVKRENWDFYVGAAYEHELDGEARGKVNGLSIRSADIGGGRVRAEIGATMKLGAKSPWSLDLNLTGFAGKKRGISGGVYVARMF